ncbi:MAG: hypothetical protein F6K41_25715 [Symploca sp. SIO3E6]|nr:hypothetical protein [Caldora sp. SIO3E6]
MLKHLPVNLLPSDLKVGVTESEVRSQERGIFMHGGEKIFFIGTAFCRLPSAFCYKR